jgi:O-antigen/teichoic acid export membrane protein
MNTLEEDAVPQSKDSLGKDTGKSAGKIGISILVAIGMGYVLTVACGRLLPPADNKVFLSFWGVLMGLGTALSPLEQELSRQSAVAAVTGGRAGKAALRALAIGGVVVALVCLSTLIPQISHKLYDGHTVLALIVLIGGISFAFQFGTRGLLIGQNQVKHFSWLVVAEASARLVLLGIFVVASLTQLVPLAIAAAAGSFAWLFFTRPAKKLVDLGVEGESWRPIASRMLLLMLSAALTASVITGYPALVSLLAPSGDNVKLGVLFAALTVARVPLTLLAPLQALAVPTVVRLSGTAEGLHRLRRLLTVGAFATLIVAAIGAVVGLLIGPWAVRLLYGPSYQAEGWWVAGLVWSAVLLTAVQLMAAVLVARTQVKQVLTCWAAVALATSATLLFFPGDTVLRAVAGLAIGPTVGLIPVLVFVLRRPKAIKDSAAGNGAAGNGAAGNISTETKTNSAE